MVSAIFSGEKFQSGWWQNSQKFSWNDPIEMVVNVCAEHGINVNLKNVKLAPFHPEDVPRFQLEIRSLDMPVNLIQVF